MDKSKIKILIAEDEESLRDLYKTKLEWDGFKVIPAKDGEEAVQKTTKENPNLILLDIMMPKKSGMDALKELKSNPSTSKIPVIMLTVLPHEEVKNQALKLGAVDYLVKSRVTPSKVVERILEELEK